MSLGLLDFGFTPKLSDEGFWLKAGKTGWAARWQGAFTSFAEAWACRSAAQKKCGPVVLAALQR